MSAHKGDYRPPAAARYVAQRFSPGIYGIWDRLLSKWAESSYCRRLSDAEKVADELNKQNEDQS